MLNFELDVVGYSAEQGYGHISLELRGVDPLFARAAVLINFDKIFRGKITLREVLAKIPIEEIKEYLELER